MFSCGRQEKVENLRKANHRSGFKKLITCKHSRKRLGQIKLREIRHLGMLKLLDEVYEILRRKYNETRN